MVYYIPEFGSIYLNPGSGAVAGDLLIARQSLAALKQRGYLFGWIEFAPSVSTPERREILELWHAIEDMYYHNPWPQESEQASADHLEQVIQQVNQVLATIVERNPDLAHQRLRAIIGCIHNQHLVFSVAGTGQAIVLHQKPNGQQQVIDILEQTRHQATTINPQRLFSQMIQGRISAKDHLFFANNHVLDFLSYVKLGQSLQDYSALESAQRLSSQLEEASSRVFFVGLIIKILPYYKAAPVQNTARVTTRVPSHVAHSQHVVTPSQASLNQLQHTRQQTHRFLKSSLVPNIRATFTAILTITTKSTIALWQRFRSRPLPHEAPPPPPTQLTPSMPGITLMGLGGAAERGLQTYQKDWGQWWYGWDHKRRLVLIALSGIILVLLQSVVWQSQQQYTNSQYDAQRQQIDSWRQIVLSAEAQLLIEDSHRASELIGTIQSEIATAHFRQPELQAQLADVQGQIKQLELRLARTTVITNPTTIVQWDNAGADELSELTLVDGNLYSYDHKNNHLRRFDLSTQEQTTIPLSTALATPRLLAEGTNVLFATADQQWYRFTPSSQSLNQVTVAQGSTQAFTIYLNRLYTISSDQQQIIRSAVVGGNYGQSQNWLKQSEDLSMVVGMAIDGTVHLLHDNGQVLRYTSGERTPYTQQAILPPLTAANALFVDTAWPWIIVLDTTQRRLVLFDKKTGTLVQQFTDPAWHIVHGAAIDTASNTIYVHHDTRVDAVDLKPWR